MTPYSGEDVDTEVDVDVLAPATLTHTTREECRSYVAKLEGKDSYELTKQVGALIPVTKSPETTRDVRLGF